MCRLSRARSVGDLDRCPLAEGLSACMCQLLVVPTTAKGVPANPTGLTEEAAITNPEGAVLEGRPPPQCPQETDPDKVPTSETAVC